MKEEKVFYVSYEEWNEACREEAIEKTTRFAMEGHYNSETGYFDFGVDNSALPSRGWHMSLNKKRVAARALNKRDMPHEIVAIDIESVEVADGLEWVVKVTVLINLEKADEEGKKNYPFWSDTITIGDAVYPMNVATINLHHKWRPEYDRRWSSFNGDFIEYIGDYHYPGYGFTSDKA